MQKFFFTSHLLLHLFPDLLNSWALLLSLTLALSFTLSLAPPPSCCRAILTCSSSCLKLGTFKDLIVKDKARETLFDFVVIKHQHLLAIL